jgi:hypothetical protein
MIDRRRRFFRGDSLLDMPIFPPVPAIPLSIAPRIPNRNWHYRLVASGHCYVNRCRKIDGVCGRFPARYRLDSNQAPLFQLCRVT